MAAPQLKPTTKPVVFLTGNKTYLKRRRALTVPVWLGTLGCTAGIFILLPFTQMIASLGKKPTELLTVDVAPPPPPPPLDMEVPDPPPQDPPPPEMERVPQQLSLSQMDVALNLGVGDAVAGAFAFDGFGMSADDAVGDLGIFDIKDLDSVPKRVRTAPLNYPPEFKRARLGGMVTLMIIISETGSVQVEKVVQSSHREFEPSAVRFAESCAFEPPKRGGRTVRARYTWPIRFEP